MTEEYYDAKALLASADEEEKRRKGSHYTLTVDEKATLRIAPAYKVVQGRAYWFSSTKRHWGAPVPNDAIEKVTFDCPDDRGKRCLTCEHKDDYPSAVWDNIRPKTRYVFNVIDVDHPEHGVQVLEDGFTLWNAIKEIIKNDEPTLLDPHKGFNVKIFRYSKQPWRSVSVGDQCDVASIHPDAPEWFKLGNLSNLDDEWRFPSLEEQYEWYGIGADPVIDVTPTPESLPAAVEAQIMEEVEVTEAEVVEDEITDVAESDMMTRLKEIANKG